MLIDLLTLCLGAAYLYGLVVFNVSNGILLGLFSLGILRLVFICLNPIEIVEDKESGVKRRKS